MNKSGLLMVMVLPVFLSGCVIVSESPRRSRAQWSSDQTVMAEIDAASEMMFDDAKAGALADIALRPHLSARAQVHLVSTAMSSLMFDNTKQKVMLVLIDNPYFVSEGKKAVLEHVDEFMFDSARQSVLQALSRRGTLPTEDELNARRHSESPLSQAPAVETEVTVEFTASYGSNL